VQQKGTKLVYPSDFIISPGSVAIHGISQEYAQQNGQPVRNVLESFYEALAACSTLVAHNISFDIGVVLSECYRSNMRDIAKKLEKCAKYCTMAKGRELLQLKKNPKLAELHEAIYNEGITNAHDAEFDTHYCARCFQALKKLAKKRAAPEPDISLTDEQLAVVSGDPTLTTLVLACAGSGKTTTVVHRIKHLLAQDPTLDESAVILTTFTRDAANGMQRKLEALLGRETAVNVGTFDSLALRFLKQHSSDALGKKTTSVSQYAPLFLAFLKSSAGKIFLKPFKHLFVDEFQDINDTQYEIIREFCKNGVVLTAVGDDAQNIYSFRGSNVKYTLRFTTLFPGSRMLKLTSNFRSTPEIVALANASIEQNAAQIPKVMRAAKVSVQKKPAVHFFEKAAAQMEFVKDKVLEIRSSKRLKLCKVAVVCPQNVFLFQMEEVLTQAGIPHVLLDGAGEVRTKQREDHVCLTTIHKAKGLEWDTVFLVMLNDQVFPIRKTPEDIVESRRLFYVAVTRPKTHLFITSCPFKDSHALTRFVTELDRDLFEFHNTNQDCFEESTHTTPTQPACIWASKHARYNSASADDDLPLPVTTVLHPQPNYAYPSFVETGNLHKEFDVFLGMLATRMTGKAWSFDAATQVLCSLKLDFAENMVYQKYRDAILKNIDTIANLCADDFYANTSSIIKSIATPQQAVSGADVGTLLGIVRKTYKQSAKHGLPMHTVPIFLDRFLPREFEASVAGALARVQDHSIPWEDVLADVWELSKCQHIIRDRRRRLLYVETPSLRDAMPLYKDLEAAVAAISHHVVAVHPSVQGLLPGGTKIMGAPDMRLTDALLNIRCSTETSNPPRAEHVIELKLLAQMTPPVQRLLVLNPLAGTLSDFKCQEVASTFDIVAQ
jgi:DNA polymerase III epsilon subunit-like protein